MLLFLKENKYEKSLMEWYSKLLKDILIGSQKSGQNTATGIALQICDVYVQEMNKTNENASLETLNGLLDPFLKCLA